MTDNDMPTLELDLDGLEALRAKAAQGEWQLIDGEAVVTDYRVEGEKRIANWIAEIDHINQEDFEQGGDWDGSDSALANGELMVAAVNALPALISRIRTLTGERDEARSQLEEVEPVLEAAKRWDFVQLDETSDLESVWETEKALQEALKELRAASGEDV